MNLKIEDALRRHGADFQHWLGRYAARVSADAPQDRVERMNAVNPRYVLRNWIAQRAIQAAEVDDFSEVEFLLLLLQNPFKVNQEAEARGYAGPPPSWAKSLTVSCSS